jgi:L-alanine-DL-glutamate epimerase-like enolase superfamily enzyme
MQDTPQLSADDDRIAWVRVASVYLPLANPISDAKVLTGRQKPMTEIAILFVEIETRDGHRGLGFSYSKRAGGPGQFAHAQEVAPSLIGENPSDISKLWDKLCWAGASVGRSGLATQAIGAFDVALWDLKAKRANLSLARLLGAHRDSVQCYNTSGGFLHTPLDQLMINTDISREKGIGGIKLKVGQPDQALDLHRVSSIRKHLGDDFPLMVDANQQWDRPTRSACAASWNNTTWSGSRNRWIATTPKVMPRWPSNSTRRSPPVKCSPAWRSTGSSSSCARPIT